MNSKQITFWLSRGIVIFLIGFMALFSLDVFVEESTTMDMIIGFMIHNIPTFILILLLILSWKNDAIGAIAFTIMGIVFTIFFNTYQRLDTFLAISFPLFLAGLLFLIHRYQK